MAIAAISECLAHMIYAFLSKRKFESGNFGIKDQGTYIKIVLNFLRLDRKMGPLNNELTLQAFHFFTWNTRNIVKHAHYQVIWI